MTTTRHGHTNFKGLQPFIGDMGPGKITHKRLDADGYMPLVFEYLCYNDYKGRPVFSMTHYDQQNGDIMRDPELTFSVDYAAEVIEPQTFQNDYLGLYQEVYRRNDEGQLLYSKRLRTDLDEFLWQWLRNIQEQGYTLNQ